MSHLILKAGNSTKDAIAIPMGDVPWADTSTAIKGVIDECEGDAQCFIALLRIAAIMYKAGAPGANEVELLAIVSKTWHGIVEQKIQGGVS